MGKPHTLHNPMYHNMYPCKLASHQSEYGSVAKYAAAITEIQCNISLVGVLQTDGCHVTVIDSL